MGLDKPVAEVLTEHKLSKPDENDLLLVLDLLGSTLGTVLLFGALQGRPFTQLGMQCGVKPTHMSNRWRYDDAGVACMCVHCAQVANGARS